MPGRVPPVTTATLRPKTDAKGRNLTAGQQDGQKVTVDFSPETLQITLTNTVQKGQGGKPAQTVTESTAKLSFTLIFDTTLTGEDVRQKTGKIANMMDPVQGSGGGGGAAGAAGGKRKVPAIVLFEWGTISFEGYIDSYKEDLDFFSSEGVPLRAALALSITQQERTFGTRDDVAYDRSGVLRQLALGGQAQTMARAPDRDLSATAAAAGDPGAARRLGAANGIENLRLPGVSAVVVTGAQERGAVGFSPPAGSAGGGGAQGGFAGLRLQGAAEPSRPRASLEVPEDGSVRAPLGGAPIAVGGKSSPAASGSLAAPVGADADLASRIKFDD